MAFSAPRCSLHPNAPAAWHCEHCARTLCTACAAPAAVAGLAICVGCGHLVELLLGPRAEIQPYRSTLPHALGRFAHPLSLGVAAIVGVVSIYFSQWSAQGWLVANAVVAAWFLVTLRRASLGFAAAGIPDWGDFRLALTGTLPRLLLALWPLALGAGLVTRYGQQSVDFGNLGAWLLAALAVALVPPALMAASVEGPGSTWPLPWKLLNTEKRLRGEMAPLRFATAGWVLLELACGFMPLLNTNDDVSLMTHETELFGVHLAMLIALGLVACTAGHLLFTHAEGFRHGEPANYAVPYHPELLPTGVWVPPVDPVVEAQKANRHQPIELEDPAEALRAAIARGDAEQAIERYRIGDVPATELSAEQHLTVAQMISSRGEAGPAAEVLRGILMRTPNDPAAPRAMIILARLCSERLGADDEARQLYRRVVERFPESDAARFAQQRLAG